MASKEAARGADFYFILQAPQGGKKISTGLAPELGNPRLKIKQEARFFPKSYHTWGLGNTFFHLQTMNLPMRRREHTSRSLDLTHGVSLVTRNNGKTPPCCSPNSGDGPGTRLCWWEKPHWVQRGPTETAGERNLCAPRGREDDKALQGLRDPDVCPKPRCLSPFCPARLAALERGCGFGMKRALSGTSSLRASPSPPRTSQLHHRLVQAPPSPQLSLAPSTGPPQASRASGRAVGTPARQGADTFCSPKSHFPWLGF